MQEPLAPTGAIGVANLDAYEPDTWPEYFKQVPTRAVRVAGPFTVLIHDDPTEGGGEISCADGYLAIDARGYPYPISVDEFDLIYGKQKRLDHASLPPTTVHELAVSHSFGVIDKPTATAATKRLLVIYGLLDENEQAPA